METQEPTFELTLKLTLPAKTLKKLKSFAMLSNTTVEELEALLVSQVEPELSAHFDRVLTQGIVEKLSELDGIRVRIATAEEADEEDAVQAAEDIDEHQLSGDDDAQENLALAEMMPKQSVPTQTQAAVARATVAPQGTSMFQFEINAPDVGSDAERFLDEAELDKLPPYQEEKPHYDSYGPYGRTDGGLAAPRGASKTFVPGKPRVRISEHTGDESGYFT